MSDVKFTKSELRSQQLKLGQLEKYLPTLQLKKAMLQTEVSNAEDEIKDLQSKYQNEKEQVLKFVSLLSKEDIDQVLEPLKILEVKKNYESIAGVEIPHFEEVVFERVKYYLFDTPLWFDDAVHDLQSLLIAKQKVIVAQEKKEILENELREVSIRVNLFEKIMIPRTLANIKKIKVFLGDQQLAAVSQAKIAKRKIEEKAHLVEAGI